MNPRLIMLGLGIAVGYVLGTRDGRERYDANVVIKTAYAEYGLSLGAGLSKVAGKVFRIGHLGSLNELMVLSAVGGAEMAMIKAGLPIRAGSGTGAAVAHFSGAGAVGLSKAA